MITTQQAIDAMDNGREVYAIVYSDLRISALTIAAVGWADLLERSTRSREFTSTPVRNFGPHVPALITVEGWVINLDRVFLTEADAKQAVIARKEQEIQELRRGL